MGASTPQVCEEAGGLSRYCSGGRLVSSGQGEGQDGGLKNLKYNTKNPLPCLDEGGKFLRKFSKLGRKGRSSMKMIDF